MWNILPLSPIKPLFYFDRFCNSQMPKRDREITKRYKKERSENIFEVMCLHIQLPKSEAL